MPRLYELAPDFQLVELPPAAPLDDAAEARIAAIWAEEMQRGTMLFNGRVYSLAEHTPARLGVRAGEYRQLVAQRRAPELAAHGLALRPVGVTGLLVAHDGVVLGRRAGHLAADAGLWETAPSGSLARLDPAGQLLEELQEELGIRPDQVSPPRPLVLAEDRASGTFDIVFRIDTALGGDAIRAAHRDSGSDEYSALAIVAPSDLAAFLAAHAALPIVVPILRHAGLIGHPTSPSR
jgi:hypothetical protein